MKAPTAKTCFVSSFMITLRFRGCPIRLPCYNSPARNPCAPLEHGRGTRNITYGKYRQPHKMPLQSISYRERMKAGQRDSMIALVSGGETP